MYNRHIVEVSLSVELNYDSVTLAIAISICNILSPEGDTKV